MVMCMYCRILQHYTAARSDRLRRLIAITISLRIGPLIARCIGDRALSVAAAFRIITTITAASAHVLRAAFEIQ